MSVVDVDRELDILLAQMQEHGESEEAQGIVRLARHVAVSERETLELLEALGRRLFAQSELIDRLATRVEILEQIRR